MATLRSGWFPLSHTQAWQIAALLLSLMSGPTFAGLPYVSDDPEQTDYKHFEIYTFNNGTGHPRWNG